MARKPGLPKKYAKFGFKKGWTMFKAAKRKVGRKIKKAVTRKKTKTKKSTKKRKTVTRRKTTMARRRTARKAAPRRRTRKRWNTATAGKIAIDSGVIGGSAIVSTLTINSLPVVKDWASWQKALTQGLTGIALLIMIPRRQIWLLKAAGGVAVGSALNFLLPFFPGAFKLTGKSRALTRSELKALTMGAPYKINGRGRTMGVPANLKGNNMGIPVPLMSGRFSNRGSGYSSRF